jgi:hypothetical protein
MAMPDAPMGPKGPDPFEYERPPVVTPIRRTSRKRSRKVKHRPRPSSRRGRLQLIAVFFALRVVDALYYVGILGAGSKSQLFAGVLVNAIWTTTLLTGIWFRKSWCRGLLILFLGLAIVIAMVALPSVLPILTNNRLIALFGVATLANAAIIWLLVDSPDIKRIASRS